MIIYFLRFIFTMMIWVGNIQGRWATFEEAPAIIDLSQDVIIKKDFDEEIVERKVTILNEFGRNMESTFQCFFNSNISKFELIEAKSTDQGKTYPVPKDHIEIKSIPSKLNALDETMSVRVAFPNASVGSVLSIKYKITTLKQPYPGYFSNSWSLANLSAFKTAKITIKSELPLNFRVNDPRQNVEVKTEKQENLQTITCTLRAPIYESLTNEASTFLPRQNSTYLSVSTVDDFKDLGKLPSQDFESVLSQPLPKELEEIKKKASSLKDPYNQIDCITSMLAEKIRYLTDSRTIEGRLKPRSLEKVCETGLGDCKDYSCATVAILRALGYQANVALVYRDTFYLPDKNDLPSLGLINHAFVKVTLNDGKVLWVDPTNPVSCSKLIFDDVAGRPAIVLDAKAPSYEQVPEINSKDSVQLIEETLEFEKGIQKVSGNVTYSGNMVFSLGGMGLFMSEKETKEIFIRGLTAGKEPLNYTVNLPNLSSRIIPSRLKTAYEYTKKPSLTLTNLGFGLNLSNEYDTLYKPLFQSSQGVFCPGSSHSRIRQITLKNIKIMNPERLNKVIETPWLTINRTCEIKGNDTIFTQKNVFLKEFIFPEEFHSKAFQDLQNTLATEVEQILLVSQDFVN